MALQDRSRAFLRKSLSLEEHMRSLIYLAQRPEVRITSASALIYGLVLWLAPALALAVTALVLAFTVAVTVARLGCALAESTAPKSITLWGDDFVSIHIATYSEPPEVVKKTLDSLAQLDYP